ncbi:unnamed protein product, partial [Mesorhabditis belari]|uniref:Uncharacterized protein n=1 Tax=Mesorhabditis belari TaxID=2138241 RepID=A0AAF3F8I8_9BILA
MQIVTVEKIKAVDPQDCSTPVNQFSDESLGSVLWFRVTWRWMLSVRWENYKDGAMGLADELEAELIRSGTQKGLKAHGWQSSINAS